ncbi:hypothetical protein CHS0354_026779 [Potamilus streckersoni]|uniref:Uncharacterized protein n=1 Tax=Potamilus streckersoni TaxID=2493646 RepID=A0AAE0T577_9BIVA|nr:hypothetical protein CHS0354_026779 [Potamilus streckersoni]
MNPDRFRLIRSSSQEMLLDQLAGHLRRHNQGKLFTQTVFIVRNNGIKHMLMHRLADREGFFGNALFCYPEDMATLLSTAQNIRNTDIRRLFEFELLQIFSDLDFYRYFTDNLTAKAPGEISRYRLCQKIAHTMLSALDYQPDAFLKGYLPHPKANRLWKKILARKKFMFAHEHYQNIRNQDATLLPVPSEIYVFGVPFLTGFEYLMLSLISEYSDIYYFQQTPSPVYRAERSNQKLPADSVNPVLDYFGRAQQVFERRLLNDNAYNLCEDFFPEASKSSSVLNDIRESMAQATDAPLDTIRSGDRSVRIHSCPNALREAETVYNEIVCFLSQHPDARPSDILITALNIRDYQPALDQVFYDNPIKIPYYITDSDEFISGDVYLLLDLLFSAQKDGIHTELLQQILDFACVRQKLGITADNVAKIHQILANIPVYKLIPGKGSEISSAFTAGGYLYESEGRLPQLYDRLLVRLCIRKPASKPGMDYEALGRLMRLTDILSEILETDKESDSALFTARTLGGWADYLQQLADILFICPPDNASQMFHAVIAYIRKTAAGLSADVPVNYQVFREFLTASAGSINLTKDFPETASAVPHC